MARGDRGSHNASRGGSTPSRSSTSHAAPAQRPVDIGRTLVPGRHACTCQARIHSLVSNCLSCGKIVCEQEGSGPCLFCGNLVCTREERTVLERGSRKSAELYKKLTGKDMPEGGLKGVSLESIASSFKNALTMRDSLLEADADSERRTHVNDLQSDFGNVAQNPFLSAEERDAILKRRDELRAIREKRRHALVVDINIDSMSATEKKQDMRETDVAYDPVIRQILDRSEERQKAADMWAEQQGALAAGGAFRPAAFVPKYRETTVAQQRAAIAAEFDDQACLSRLSDEAAALEVERRGYSLALQQPIATLVANGLVKFVRWPEDPMLVGPIFVCSSPSLPAEKDGVADAIRKYKLPPSVEALDFSCGSVLGRAFLSKVHTLSDYEEEYNAQSSAVAGRGNFVLEFSSHEPLITSIPHIPPVLDEIYQLDPALKSALSHVFAG